MSEANHKTDMQPQDEHGTFRSYATGFLLSLICTAIPYYLVVHKTLSSDSLLAVIMGFATVQVFIQVFFFLHLGRGPKPLYNLTVFVSTLGIIAIVMVGSLFIMKHLHYNMAPDEVTTKLAQDEGISQIGGELTGACQVARTNHAVTIFNGAVTPLFTEAQRCDTLTFINQDSVTRDIAFGSHPQHESYGGESELTLRPGQSKTIMLNQTGAYQFHDHLHPEVTGNFTVTAP